MKEINKISNCPPPLVCSKPVDLSVANISLISKENTLAYAVASSDFNAHDILHVLCSAVYTKLWYLIAHWAL